MGSFVVDLCFHVLSLFESNGEQLLPQRLLSLRAIDRLPEHNFRWLSGASVWDFCCYFASSDAVRSGGTVATVGNMAILDSKAAFEV